MLSGPGAPRSRAVALSRASSAAGLGCGPITPEAIAAVRQSIELGVTAIVARDCRRDWMLDVVEPDRPAASRWIESLRDGGYVLFVRNTGT